MDSDELQTYMENNLPAKDIETKEPPVEGNESARIESKDFVSHSG